MTALNLNNTETTIFINKAKHDNSLDLVNVTLCEGVHPVRKSH